MHGQSHGVSSAVAPLRSLLLATVLLATGIAARAQECTWEQVATIGPAGRMLHAMAYDSARSVAVLFGGIVRQGVYSGETWEWNGVEWTLVADSGPSPRFAHAMTYDSQRGVTVLFGGGSRAWETWEWNGIEWRLAATTGPALRWSHAMAYDSARGVTVLFGGHYLGVRMGDTWEWDGLRWARVADFGPSPRYGHAMTYDSRRGVTVLFGGNDDPEGFPNDETWEWNGTTWTYRGSGPYETYQHAMSYDSHRGVTVTFGGDTYHYPTWEWDGLAWRRSTAMDPSDRRNPAMAYDASRQVTVLFGGYDGPYFGDTWEYRCAPLIRLSVAPTCPSGGPARVGWSGATPDGRIAVLFARDEGAVSIPPGNPCEGTRLGLGASQLQIAWLGRSDGNGGRILNANAPPAACGGFLQLLDLTACATSNVARVE